MSALLSIAACCCCCHCCCYDVGGGVCHRERRRCKTSAQAWELQREWVHALLRGRCCAVVVEGLGKAASKLVHREKRNRFSFMNKSYNTQCNLTKFSTFIVNEYYHQCYLFNFWVFTLISTRPSLPGDDWECWPAEARYPDNVERAGAELDRQSSWSVEQTTSDACSTWWQLFWTSAATVTFVVCVCWRDSDIKHFMFTSKVMKLIFRLVFTVLVSLACKILNACQN